MPEFVDREGRPLTEYVADQVREAIYRSGHSPHHVAQASGINRSTMYRSLNDGRPFDTDELARIAQTLGLHPAELVKLEGFVIEG